ncbi:hypothetical protein K474DRAFT_1660276 [Panus rudis PR-1116 ss-1]|nr:hypothetical protein K474DRAFT_1660276 [Panus rudis PR-1116 ss-1]
MHRCDIPYSNVTLSVSPSSTPVHAVNSTCQKDASSPSASIHSFRLAVRIAVPIGYPFFALPLTLFGK